MYWANISNKRNDFSNPQIKQLDRPNSNNPGDFWEIIGTHCLQISHMLANCMQRNRSLRKTYSVEKLIILYSLQMFNK